MSDKFNQFPNNPNFSVTMFRSNLRFIHWMKFITLAIFLIGYSEQSHAQSRCEKTAPDSVYIAFIIDPSHEINMSQRVDLKREFEEILQSVEPCQRSHLSIIVDQDSLNTARRKIIKVVSPDRPSQGCNRFRSACKSIERKWENYPKSIINHLDGFLSSGSIESSPIIEILGLIDHQICQLGCHHVWIVSDMLQHSSLLSMYETIPDFQTIKRKIEKNYGFPETFQNSSIKIWQLGRSLTDGGEIQELDQFQEFWNQYFNLVNGSKPTWEYVPIYE